MLTYFFYYWKSGFNWFKLEICLIHNVDSLIGNFGLSAYGMYINLSSTVLSLKIPVYTWVISLCDMKVSRIQRVMLANRRKVMICLPGLLTCWARVIHTRRPASLIIIPAKILDKSNIFYLEGVRNSISWGSKCVRIFQWLILLCLLRHSPLK